MDGSPARDTWTVQEAKGRLSEILRRARAGTPQRIGVNDPCYVVSEQVLHREASSGLGAWLVRSAPRGHALQAPQRGSSREIPFTDESPPDEAE